ncbi:hypothetical protein D3C74_481680 [compost metagenome]
MRKQLACAAHAGLHFIHDQQQAMLLAQVHHSIQELLLHFQYAPFSQDHLQHDRCSIIRNGCF